VTLKTGVRAYANPGKITLGSGENVGVAVHELAHTVEFEDARALNRSLAFLKARTANEPLKHMGPGYGPREFTREDKFFSRYIGKDYGPRATEVTSMGYQAMAEDLEKLQRQDPEMLLFLLGQLAGI
jgi:hypothetical protein